MDVELDISKLKMATFLTNLEEFRSRCIISMDNVILILNSCKSIKLFEFKIADSSNYEALKDSLSKEWSISIDDWDCVLIKALK